MRRTSFLTAAVGVGLALSLTAIPVGAKTPDGKTPSEETVCDEVANNLFGLCNAYCEAMDCDSPEAHAEGCDSVLANYLDKSGGETPPCEDVEEPEIDPGDLAIEQNDFFVPGVGF